MLASSSRHVLTTAQRRAPAVAKHARRASTQITDVTNDKHRRRHASTMPAVQRNNTRADPFAFTPDDGRNIWDGNYALTRFNMALSKYADRHMSLAALRVCKQMKEGNVEPDVHTYNLLLSTLAEDTWTMEAWAIYEDMQAMGVRPDVHTFNALLKTNRYEDTLVLWDIMHLMEEAGIQPNSLSYSLILERYHMANNLEMALQTFVEMQSRGLSIGLPTMESLITLAAELGYGRLAVNLADNFEQTTVRRLGVTVWVNCLSVCAENLYADGVIRCWAKVVDEFNVTPDEGLCIEVLHVASRHGLPELAGDAIRVLKIIGLTLREYHFAPLIEALCGSGRIKEAIVTLDIMRQNDIPLTSQTAEPIVQATSKDVEAIDGAWGMLDEMRDQGETIDVSALNALIQASVKLGDYQRAVGIYKESASLGVKPNADTFNSILAGCTGDQHRELGDRLLAEMKDLGIKPDVHTYQNLIFLCLTQSVYEDAFFYLEEMKGQNLLPPIDIYIAIIRKCVEMGDTRFRLAVEEMVECGYAVSPKLQRLIDTGGAVGSEEDNKKSHLQLEEIDFTRMEGYEAHMARQASTSESVEFDSQAEESTALLGEYDTRIQESRPSTYGAS